MKNGGYRFSLCGCLSRQRDKFSLRRSLKAARRRNNQRSLHFFRGLRATSLWPWFQNGTRNCPQSFLNEKPKHESRQHNVCLWEIINTNCVYLQENSSWIFHVLIIIPFKVILNDVHLCLQYVCGCILCTHMCELITSLFWIFYLIIFYFLLVSSILQSFQTPVSSFPASIINFMWTDRCVSMQKNPLNFKYSTFLWYYRCKPKSHDY